MGAYTLKSIINLFRSKIKLVMKSILFLHGETQRNNRHIISFYKKEEILNQFINKIHLYKQNLTKKYLKTLNFKCFLILNLIVKIRY